MAKRRTTFPELSRILGYKDFAPAPAKVQPAKSKQGFIERYNVLPALGAILGGGVGLFGGGPFGAAAGAGLGGAGGEALEQILFKKPNLKGLLAEGAISAAAPGLGN